MICLELGLSIRVLRIYTCLWIRLYIKATGTGIAGVLGAYLYLYAAKLNRWRAK